MLSQWDCLFKNLGEWVGSFTQFSPNGELIQNTPTITKFVGLNNNETMKQTIIKLMPDQTQNETVLEYSNLSRGMLLFENGGFSFGSMQWGPFSQFGAELGLIDGERRLRLVQLFNQESVLDQLTLIREKLSGSSAEEKPQLTGNDLIGEWQGEAITIYPDFSNPEIYEMSLKINVNENELTQKLKFGDKEINSIGIIKDNIITFNQGSTPVQVLLLPDGASATSPLKIEGGKPFFLEVGWLIKPNVRQRMIRRYNDKGEWISLTLVKEEKNKT